jgi:Trk K+ transport system NAD-binding subunit
MKIRTHLQDTIDSSSEYLSLLIVSDSHIGSRLATDIDSVRIHLITNTPTVASQTPDSVQTTVGTITRVETLRTGADATIAVVALQRDRQALLVAQLLRTQFEMGDLLVLVNDPNRREAFDDIASFVVCVSSCLSAELGGRVEQQLSEARTQQ